MHQTTFSRVSRAILPFVLALAPSGCAPSPRLITPHVASPVARVTPALPVEAIAPAPIAPLAAREVASPAQQPAPSTEATPRDQVRAVVLLYHMLNGLDDEMSITPAAFEEQIRWLVDHRIPVVATSHLVSFLDGKGTLPERVAVIQIDDGHASAYAKAYPILKRHGLPFTVALNTAAMEASYPNTMGWAAVREMLSSGLCEVASHSHIHGHMDKLTNARNES